jgi:glutamate carboxypeptidase
MASVSKPNSKLNSKLKPEVTPELTAETAARMQALLRTARAQQNSTIQWIQRYVECESPSDDPAAVNRFVDLFTESVRDVAKVRAFKAKGYGNHLRAGFQLPGRKKSTNQQLLALGHSDTVWPIGTLRTMPSRVEKGRIWGPGVFDMKGGLALLVGAVRILRELDLPITRKLLLQLNSDEEIGSPSSRPLTEEAARQSEAVLVLEPSAGLAGNAKIARKGVGDYTVTVHGKSAHAGLDFVDGASAIVEMARQIEQIAGFTKLDRGITVSPGVIQGGTRSNVVAAKCVVEVDVRVPRMVDGKYLEKAFKSLKPFDKRCRVVVSGGLNRPPLEQNSWSKLLFLKAKSMSESMGIPLDGTMVGGGSDGNFTAALGVATLDGMGAVGEGAHAVNESILVDRIADRMALIAGLIIS